MTGRVAAALPAAAAVFFACLGVISTSLLLLEAFNGLLALALAVVLTALAMKLLGRDAEELTRRALALDVAALVLAGGFFGLQAVTSGANLVVERDPGVYTVTAKWLTNHRDVDIDTQASLFGPPGGITYPSAGFGPTTTPDHVYAQGAHVVPAVVAAFGSLGGDRLLFRTNALVGAFALLAAYGLGRRVVGREAALAATVLLGATLPSLAFSRDVYTEPYSQLLLLGGLALLWRTTPGKPGQWAVAGLVLGGSCLARIDAFLALPFVVTYAALVLAVAAPERRRRTAIDVGALLGAAAVPALLGYLDLSRLSPGYYHDLRSNFVSLMHLLVASVLFAVVLVAAAWLTPLPRWLSARDERWWSRIGALAFGAVVLVGLALAARPLLYTAHDITQKPVQLAIESLQRNERVAVDGSRSYAEQSVTWLGWYLGPVAAAAALFGTALLLRGAIVRRDVRMAPFLLVFVSTAALYLVNPSITPDQIWAMRRYVPSVLPGACFAATFALGLVISRFHGRTRSLVAGALAFAVLGPVLFISRPFLFVREYGNQNAEIARVCAALPAEAALLVVGSYLSPRYPMTTRTFCDVPSVAQPTLDPARAQAARTALVGRELFVLTADVDLTDLPVSAAAGAPVAVSTTVVRVWARVLTTPPRQAPPRTRSLYLGRVGADGTVASWVSG